MKSLGQILRERRESRELTFEQVEEATKIRKIYLKGLEDGEYRNLPSATQIKGFLRIYANYLDLPEKDIFAFFRREFDETKDGVIIKKGSLSPVREPLFRFTPHVLFTGIVISAIAILFAYVWVQYQSFAGAPQMEIFSPKDGIVSQKAELDIEGKVSANSSLNLNGQSIGLAQDGYFKTSIQLSDGVNVLTFVAVNEVGKSTTIKRVVRFDTTTK